MKKIMKKCLPVIDNVFHLPPAGFSFIAKEGKLEYSVYDTKVMARKRELETVEGEPKNIDLYCEALGYYTSSYKRIGENKIEVWDPDVVEYEDVELPLYRKNKDKSFTYMREVKLLKGVPTQKMVNASKAYLANIRKQMRKDAVNAEAEAYIQVSPDGVSTILQKNYPVEEFFDEEEYYTFPLKRPYKYVGDYVTLIIKKSNISEYLDNGRLPILVPNAYAGMAIGKGGRCSKKMAEDLGIKLVDVKTY